MKSSNFDLKDCSDNQTDILLDRFFTVVSSVFFLGYYRSMNDHVFMVSKRCSVICEHDFQSCSCYSAHMNTVSVRLLRLDIQNVNVSPLHPHSIGSMTNDHLQI